MPDENNKVEDRRDRIRKRNAECVYTCVQNNSRVHPRPVFSGSVNRAPLTGVVLYKSSVVQSADQAGETWPATSVAVIVFYLR